MTNKLLRSIGNFISEYKFSALSGKFSIFFMRIFLIAFCVLSSFDSYGYQNAGVLEIHQKSTLKKTNYLTDAVISSNSDTKYIKF